MAAIFTPGQLAKRGEFYYQLAQYMSAGVAITYALEQIRRNPPARSYVEPLRVVQVEIGHGLTLVEAMRRVPRWLPEFDLSLVGAGEQSGRIDACMKLLANYYQTRARMARQVLSDLAYPVVLLHIAVFLLPFAQFFTSGNLVQYAGQTFGVLVPLYLVAALMIAAGQSQHGERWRSLWEMLLHRVPVLGTARASLALSRLCAALGALLSAGVTIIEAWELASVASGSPRLHRAVANWRPALEAGQTPAEAVQASGEFPHLFTSQYAAGEISGTLEENLERLYHYYEEESTRKFHALCSWMPRLFYFAIVIVIAYRVLSFWTDYFKQIEKVLNF